MLYYPYLWMHAYFVHMHTVNSTHTLCIHAKYCYADRHVSNTTPQQNKIPEKTQPYAGPVTCHEPRAAERVRARGSPNSGIPNVNSRRPEHRRSCYTRIQRRRLTRIPPINAFIFRPHFIINSETYMWTVGSGPRKAAINVMRSLSPQRIPQSVAS